MKSILLFVSLLVYTSGHAAVWRLNNTGANATFSTTLQFAIDNSSNGDTIHVESSSTSYGDATINKRITLIGPGYWLNENDSTQANKTSATIGSLTFQTGSENSKICGLSVVGVININADSIVIARNYINRGVGSGDHFQIYLYGSMKGIQIIQNWISVYTQISSSTSRLIKNDGSPNQSFKIHNNFLRCNNSGTQYAISLASSANSNISVINNVIWGTIETNGAYVANNIQLSGGIGGAGNSYYNNLGHLNQFPQANDNHQNVGMSNIFVDYDLYIDKGYILNNIPGNPNLAIGAGINGGDCGAFGYHTTGTPYKLSGLPDIPSIFELTYELINGIGPINITVKAKSNN